MEPQQFLGLLQNIGAVTKLTRLSVDTVVQDGQHYPELFSISVWLKGLTGLRHLGLVRDLPHGSPLYDTLHLTALKALTRLSLAGDAAKLDETAAAALALELTDLEVLLLGFHGDTEYWGTAALPAIGKLTRLKSLSLGGGFEQCDAQLGLHFLTNLTRMTHLCGFDLVGDDELAGFWRLVRRPRS